MPTRLAWMVWVVLAVQLGCQPASNKVQPTPSRPVQSADFPKSLLDRNGQVVELKAYRGRPVVLVVVRGMPESPGGTYCPFCLAQASSLVAKYDEFKSRGAEVLLVFPGTADSATEFSKQVLSQGEDGKSIPFTMCVDQDCTACDRLGIRGDLAKPSTFILDGQGEVVYAYVGKSTSDRPTLATILQQLDQLKKSFK
jgi:peroxiredoxin